MAAIFNKIIVLGMDNTGKTTLCNQLSKALGYQHVNSLGPKASPWEMMNFIEYTMKSKDPMVLERFCFFEEMVYGNVLRGHSNFDWSSTYLETIQEAFPLIIYCRPSRQKIFSFGSREQMDGVIEQSEKLLNAFDDLYFKLTGMKFFVTIYDFESLTADELVTKIKTWKGVN